MVLVELIENRRYHPKPIRQIEILELRGIPHARLDDGASPPELFSSASFNVSIYQRHLSAHVK